MKSTELRLGNYLLFSVSSDFLKVTDISNNLICSIFYGSDKKVCSDIEDFICSDIEDFICSDITEEWLLKLGFRKSKLMGHDSHFQYHHHLLHSNILALYNSDFSIQLDNVARGIQYVHQLQNIFYIITGEELVIQ